MPLTLLTKSQEPPSSACSCLVFVVQSPSSKLFGCDKLGFRAGLGLGFRGLGLGV